MTKNMKKTTKSKKQRPRKKSDLEQGLTPEAIAEIAFLMKEIRKARKKIVQIVRQ